MRSYLVVSLTAVDQVVSSSLSLIMSVVSHVASQTAAIGPCHVARRVSERSQPLAPTVRSRCTMRFTPNKLRASDGSGAWWPAVVTGALAMVQ